MVRIPVYADGGIPKIYADGGIRSGASPLSRRTAKNDPQDHFSGFAVAVVRIPLCVQKKDTFWYPFFIHADGGIRTLVPRRANAFRVRPVMTTSIRLQISLRVLSPGKFMHHYKTCMKIKSTEIPYYCILLSFCGKMIGH